LHAPFPFPTAKRFASDIEAIILTGVTENLGYLVELVGFPLPRKHRPEVDELSHDCT
jgi:hypothetical protein